MSFAIPFKEAPHPNKVLTLEVLRMLGTDDDLRIRLDPPIRVHGRDVKRNGDVSIGRLAACHVMGGDIPELAGLTAQARFDYARGIEAEINTDMTSVDSNNPLEFATAVYGALLRVGVRAVIEDPGYFIDTPEAE